MLRKLTTGLLAMALVFSAAGVASAETIKTPASDGSVNVRSGAGMSYSPIAWAKNGDTVEVLGTSGSWIQVKLAKNGKTGYVYKSYINGTGGSTGSTATGDARITTKYASSRVNIRATAGGAVIGSLKNGTQLAITGSEGDWYSVKVVSTGMTGYVSKAYVSSAAYVTTGNVNLRSGAGTSYSVIRVIPKGSTIAVVSAGEKWSQVTYDGASGYIYNKYYASK